MGTNQVYQLLWANQGVDNKDRYKLIKETPMYFFFKKIPNASFVFRVHKKTKNVKGIKEGKNGYQFDMPRIDIINKF